MFRKNKETPEKSGKPASRKDVPSVISSDFNMLGNIICDGMIDFDGKIDGNIQCQSLVIRHHAVINGEVTADTVQIYGKVKGLIRAKHVALLPSSVVEGIIMHQTITIADGAVVEGKMKRTDKPSSDDYESYDDGHVIDGSSAHVMDGFKLITGSKNS